MAPNRTVAHDLTEPEGPAYDPEGNLYVVEMAADRACVDRVGTDGEVAWRSEPVGRPNGLAIDGDGNLWVAEARHGSVLCLSPNGDTLKQITGADDEPFLWANDLAFGPDGHLYLTDSGIRDTDFITGISIRPDWQSARYDGRVCQIDPVKGVVTRVLDRGLAFANGIAFGPDNVLYAAETIGGAVYRYDVFGSGACVREPFGNVNEPDGPDGFRGPDGMAFAQDGRLYCTVYGQGGVTVLDGAGKVSERIPTNELRPTNIAFIPGQNAAVVTEVLGSCVELIETGVAGLPLHAPTGISS